MELADVPVGIVVVDGAGAVLESNAAADELLCGATLPSTVDPDDRDRLLGHLAHVLGSGEDLQTHLTLQVGDKTLLLTSRRSGEHVLVAITDVSPMQRRLEEAVQRSLHDPLTGLANRTLFIEHLEQTLRSSSRTRDTVALLFIDIDNFKLVNDSHTHAVGDEVLVELAERFRRSVRPTDVVARLGGDEFVALLTGADLAEAEDVAERILEVVGEVAAQTSAGPVDVSVSIGISVEAPGTDPDRAVGRADTAMYAAKARGRSRLAVWEPGLHEIIERDVVDLRELSRQNQELQARYDTLVREARRDSRTGLQDETAFEADRQRLEDDGEDYTLVFADLDFFHQYNGRYTHLGGHEALAAAAGALRKAVGERGTVYRYGGEEFTAVIPRSKATIAEAEELARSLPSVVAGLRIPHEDSPFGVVTITVGVAHRSCCRGDVTLAADEAMFAGKGAGKNRAVIAGD